MSLISRIRDRHTAATADEEWLTTPPAPEGTPPRPPKGNSAAHPGDDPPLTADRAAAVRFQVAKPGYAFDQVESFVAQTRQSLTSLEEGLYQRDVSVHTLQQEVEALEEKVATLQATIEVFRANGDPDTTADGDYVTESQWEDLQAAKRHAEETSARLAVENEDLRAHLADLEARHEPPAIVETSHDDEALTQLRAERESLQANLDEYAAALTERDVLIQTLNERISALEAAAASQPEHENHDQPSPDVDALAALETQIAELTAERDDAFQEIEELRAYIDTELAKWTTAIAQQEPNIPTSENTPEQPADNEPSPHRRPAPLHDAPELL